eukprot:TRINITY_DN22832_c0_g2_i1.p2 TRINITY_DN22832_c0_g2~~TRINITY_DN22832_c0_g2_i1.p2  ORF type:complete len:162 (-),score=20.48 TRINITY_DN22832_c0_g2_i1:169-654(-)
MPAAVTNVRLACLRQLVHPIVPFALRGEQQQREQLSARFARLASMLQQEARYVNIVPRAGFLQKRKRSVLSVQLALCRHLIDCHASSVLLEGLLQRATTGARIARKGDIPMHRTQVACLAYLAPIRTSVDQRSAKLALSASMGQDRLHSPRVIAEPVQDHK